MDRPAEVPPLAHTGRARLLCPCPIALLLFLLLGAGASGAERPRNLLLLSLDTLRPDHLSCYGYGRETSPALDALAARGVRFADASSASPWTLPSHATLFTGLYPSRHGVKDYNHRLPPKVVTLAEVLGAQGFQTFAVVNTWNIATPRFGLFQGFAPADVHYVRETDGMRVMNNAPQVAGRVRRFLADRDADRPFFLFAHFYDPHADYAPRPEYRERFVSPYQGRLRGESRELGLVDQRDEPLGAADLRFLRELYDAEIRQLDDVLSEFFAYLREAGLADDTLVVVTSDHGEAFGEHGDLLHGKTHHQEQLAVPLILAGPGIPVGRVVEQPVSLVDLMPTLLAHFGLDAPPGLDGIDLGPAWRGRALPERILFAEADRTPVPKRQAIIDAHRMARAGSTKLLLERASGRAELFDLGNDPGEQRDAAKARPADVERLRAALENQLGHPPAPTTGAGAPELTPEEREHLRALGYLSDE